MTSESPSGDSRDERRVLLSITVEIEDGRVEQIELKQGDSPEEVSSAFCREHDLPLQFVTPLTEHITYNLSTIKDHDTSPRPRQKTPPPHRGKSPHSHCLTDVVSQARRAYMERPKTLEEIRKYQAARTGTKPVKFSQRLLQPTFTFSTKTVMADRRKEKTRHKRKAELSEKMKALCLRLYSDYMRQRQRVEEEGRLLAEQYQEKIAKDKPPTSQKSRRLMRNREREAEQFQNYGELLYQEAIFKFQERRRLIEKKQQEDEMNELKLITSKPEISKLAKRLKRTEVVWERLVQDKQNQEHLQELRNELWEAKLMECTFKPRINYLHSFERRDVQTTTRFDQLFYDAEHRRRRQAEYMQWYPEGVTFHPHINKSSAANVDEHPGMTVFDRLLQYAERVAEKRQKYLESGGRKLMDPTTGQELFTPAIGRQPAGERNTMALPIGEFLYQMKFSMDEKKRSQMDKDNQTRTELAKCSYVTPRSIKLLNHLKERKTKQIFDHLDKDKSGYVDLDSADVSLLSNEILEELNIVKSMDEGKGSLSYDTFQRLMQTAQKKLGANGLHCIFKLRQKSEPFPFQFKMCRLSRTLANRRRKFSSRSQWYKLILLDRQERIAKVEALRKEKQKQEMAECTFTPAIHGGKGMRRSPYSTNSTIVEKEKQEVHGFIFQEPQDE